jgi:hypothetical protein
MKYISLLFFCVLLLLQRANAQTTSHDSLYYRNFVYHQDGTLCNHLAPQTSFTFFLNRNMNAVVTENAPRWSPSVDANIDGKGTFGVELANFSNPSMKIGDSIFVLFTCKQTNQQGLLADAIPSIPWVRFPLGLHMSPIAVPDFPQNVVLQADSNKVRTLTWLPTLSLTYSVYRRNLQDTLGDYPRKMYIRIAVHISGNTYRDTSALKDKYYGYILFAESASGAMSAHSAEVQDATPAGYGDDLDVGWIARLPRYNYEWGSTNPDIDGWPYIGQTVTWQVNVKSWFLNDLNGVQYKWYLDGVQVDSGSINISAGALVTVNLPWIWTFTRHEIKFVIDPNNHFQEEEEQNNELMVYTNAIAAGFYVEQSTYNYFRRYQKELRVHSNSWEDWAQRHVKRWNQMFASAVFPESPNGVIDRIRLDNITIVPDKALPLAGGLATNNPNLNDRSVDLQWGFTAEGIQGSFYANHISPTDNNAFYFEGSLLHELGHARYLIDVYGFNVQDNGTGNTVAIKENGSLVVGTLLMSKNYYTPMTGLMNGQYTYVDRYSAAAMNLIAGHRAVKGNYNAPDNIGIFMDDLPSQNRLTLKDAEGNIIPNANLKVYRAAGQAGVWYGKYFDDTPDMQLASDSAGRVLLGRCPFSSTGTITHDYGYSNAVIILRVAAGSKVGYAFFESLWMNLQYWGGHTSLGEYELQVSMMTTSSVARIAPILPVDFTLKQNYPNPFNNSTNFEVSVGNQTVVKVEIFDLLGKKVAELLNEKLEPGTYRLPWDASNVPSGVYFTRMTAGNFVQTKRAVLIK